MPDGLEDGDAARHLVSTPKSEGFFVGGGSWRHVEQPCGYLKAAV